LNPLTEGAQLQEFVIERLIGIGGFGIVYQANDTLLHRKVAIKEYMPTSMASRTDGVTVSLRSATYREDFESGKTSFINEARMLARFKHSALIEVFRFWEQNSTAYMATPFYEGRTLKEKLIETPGVPEERTLKQMLMPVLDALEHMHREQVYHRDISPDNIMILDDGRPILLDLGAARAQQIENAQAMTVLVKPGYAPIEQYAGDASVQQGPWTDIYGWGASAYFALTGKPPPPSASRIMSDSIIKLVDAKPAGYSEVFLAAIDAALAVRPDDRPQSVAALKLLFDHEVSEIVEIVEVVEAVEVVEVVEDLEVTQIFEAPKSIASGVVASTIDASTPNAATLADPVKKSIPAALIGLGGICTIGLIAALWWFAQPTSKPSIAKPSTVVAPIAVAPVVPPLVPSEVEPAVVSAAVSAAVPVLESPKPSVIESQVKEDLKPVVEKPATARFTIKPWGEVYVNGAGKGVSPPLKSLSLPAGEHNIEIRNGDYPSHKLKIQLKGGEVFKVNHTFVDSAQK
jgi:serine/threonine protein kinase